MNNTDLVRKLIREFLLSEENLNIFGTELNDKEINFNEWRAKFLKMIELLPRHSSSLGSENKRRIKDGLPKSEYYYDSWLRSPISFKDHPIILRDEHGNEIVKTYFNDKNELINTINQYDNLSRNSARKIKLDLYNEKQNNVENNPEENQEIENYGITVKRATEYGLTKDQIRYYTKKGSNGEYLIAAILGDKEGITKTPKYELWDIELPNKVKYEVKDATSGAFFTGKTGKNNAVNFINEVSAAFHQIEKLIKNINASKLKEIDQYKQLLNKIDLSLYQNLKKGSIPAGKEFEIRNTFISVNKLKDDILKIPGRETQKNLSVKFSSAPNEIQIPEDKKSVYYLTINYLEKNLGIDSSLILDDSEKDDYIKSLFLKLDNPLFDQKNMDALIQKLKNPLNNFNEEIKGLFVIKNLNSEDPSICYIPREFLDKKLKFERVSDFKVKYML